MSDVAETAENNLQRALTAEGARDPREYYRGQLKELRQVNPAGYDVAVAYYSDTLIPGVASGDSDPLTAWLEYGRVIAEAMAPGQTVEVDRAGRRTVYASPTPRDRLVLHMPETGARALLVGLPTDLSDAQRATFDLLVKGKLKLRNA